MKTSISDSKLRPLFYRLIALWVIVEGVAGGIMHGLKIPFSGMVISGGAVICICLIGYFIPVKGAILKATIVVMIFKMMISPHTPPTAYLAVLFQGLIGQLLFSGTRFYKFSAILLGILALVESAIQRLLVLIVLYGSTFWNAVNEFIRKSIGEKEVTNYSMWMAGIYIAIHAIVGCLIGLLAARIIRKASDGNFMDERYLIDIPDNLDSFILGKKSKKRRKLKLGLIIVWIILLILFFQSLFKIGTPVLESGEVIYIFFRSLLIFLTWLILVQPLVSIWIKRRLENHQKKSQTQVDAILLLLPSTEYLFRNSWTLSSSQKGLGRLGLFWKIMLMNTLRDL